MRTLFRSLDSLVRLDHVPLKAFRALHFSHEITFVETGVGIERAVRPFDLITRAGKPPEGVISIGYCGGLVPGASVGDLVWATAVHLVDEGRPEVLLLPDQDRVFQRLSSSTPILEGTFFTLRRWMKKADVLARVPAGVPLPVCEMETFGLARLARERGLPFFAIRSVSDGDREEVGFDPSAVCDSAGIYRPSRALALFISRPHLLGSAMKLRRNASIASRSLARGVEALLKIL